MAGTRECVWVPLAPTLGTLQVIFSSLLSFHAIRAPKGILNLAGNNQVHNDDITYAMSMLPHQHLTLKERSNNGR